MILFLTGAVGCGKSTVVDAVIARTSLAIGGFRTGFGPDRASADRSLYLWGAWEEPRFDAPHTVARFSGGVPTPVPQRFDALGTAYLERPAELFILDECGRLERDAKRFQAAVLEKLGGSAHVLGVAREGFPGWTKSIAAWRGVEVWTVEPGNREELPEKILRRMA